MVCLNGREDFLGLRRISDKINIVFESLSFREIRYVKGIVKRLAVFERLRKRVCSVNFLWMWILFN